MLIMLILYSAFITHDQSCTNESFPASMSTFVKHETQHRVLW